MAQDLDPKSELKAFARNLQAARKRARLTQDDMAELLGLSRQSYPQYERAITWPSVGKLRHICQALQVSADTLLFGVITGDEAPPLPRERQGQLRRLLRELRGADAYTLRVVRYVLSAIEKRSER